MQFTFDRGRKTASKETNHNAEEREKEQEEKAKCTFFLHPRAGFQIHFSSMLDKEWSSMLPFWRDSTERRGIENGFCQWKTQQTSRLHPHLLTTKALLREKKRERGKGKLRPEFSLKCTCSCSEAANKDSQGVAVYIPTTRNNVLLLLLCFAAELRQHASRTAIADVLYSGTFSVFFLSLFLPLLLKAAKRNFLHCPWWRVTWAANKREGLWERRCFDRQRKFQRTSLLDKKRWLRKTLALIEFDNELRISAPLRSGLHFLPIGLKMLKNSRSAARKTHLLIATSCFVCRCYTTWSNLHVNLQANLL